MGRPIQIIARALVAASVAGGALAADKPAASKSSERSCFYVRDIDGFNAPDEHTVYVRVGVKTIYRLDLMSDCLDLTWRQSIGLKMRPGSPWICDPLDADVVYRETGAHERCPITGIHKLSAEEAAALPKKDRP